MILGIVIEESDELEAINLDDRLNPKVLAVRVNLYLAPEKWELMSDIARRNGRQAPDRADRERRGGRECRRLPCQQ